MNWIRSTSPFVRKSTFDNANLGALSLLGLLATNLRKMAVDRISSIFCSYKYFSINDSSYLYLSYLVLCILQIHLMIILGPAWTVMKKKSNEMNIWKRVLTILMMTFIKYWTLLAEGKCLGTLLYPHTPSLRYCWLSAQWCFASCSTSIFSLLFKIRYFSSQLSDIYSITEFLLLLWETCLCIAKR